MDNNNSDYDYSDSTNSEYGDESKNKYFIKVSVLCSDYYDELSWEEGYYYFVDNTFPKNKLLKLEEELWEKFYSSEHSRKYRDEKSIIAYFENGNMNVLYSDCMGKTNVDTITDVKDVVNNTKYDDLTYEIIEYEDELPLYKTFIERVKIIQNWWKEIYYSPHTKVGKKRLDKSYNKLIESN